MDPTKTERPRAAGALSQRGSTHGSHGSPSNQGCVKVVERMDRYRVLWGPSPRGKGKGGVMAERSYEELLAEVDRLRDEGRVPTRPTREQMIDWAYGNTKIENNNVTREMAARAVTERYGEEP